MKKFLPLLLVFALLFSLSACGDEPADDDASLDSDKYYFWDAEVYEHGDSQFLVEHVDSVYCAEDALAAWYKQDVAGTDFAYAILVYDDEENRGVYAADGVISRDVVIEDLSYTGDTDKTDVFVYNNGKLEKQ